MSFSKIVVSSHVDFSLASSLRVESGPSPVYGAQARSGQIIFVEAPVRIDLAGGWSDTPPICYESSGAVC